MCLDRMCMDMKKTMGFFECCYSYCLYVTTCMQPATPESRVCTYVVIP